MKVTYSLGTKVKTQSKISQIASYIRANYKLAIFSIIILFAGSAQVINMMSVKQIFARKSSLSPINIISPAEASNIPAKFTLKAQLSQSSQDAYDMFWYADNGTWNWMDNNLNPVDSKTATIDVTNWKLHKPSDRYTIFVVSVNKSTGRLYLHNK